MMIGVQADIVLRDRRDHIPTTAALPQPGLLAHNIHRGNHAVVGQHVGDVARDVVGIRMDEVFDVKAEIDVHAHLLHGDLGRALDVDLRHAAV